MWRDWCAVTQQCGARLRALRALRGTRRLRRVGPWISWRGLAAHDCETFVSGAASRTSERHERGSMPNWPHFWVIRPWRDGSFSTAQMVDAYGIDGHEEEARWR